nr:immunoglobulin heavy chain junction region [Mus musculus]
CARDGGLRRKSYFAMDYW